MVHNLKQQISEYCRFCSPPDKERILYETDNFYVMLSLGPIVEGYLLIISKEHYHSSALFGGNIAKEFDMLVTKVSGILLETYGSCLIFEHGRAGSSLKFTNGKKHCFHAHMHLIPTRIAISEVVNEEHVPINLLSWQDFRNKYSMIQKQ